MSAQCVETDPTQKRRLTEGVIASLDGRADPNDERSQRLGGDDVSIFGCVGAEVR